MRFILGLILGLVLCFFYRPAQETSYLVDAITYYTMDDGIVAESHAVFLIDLDTDITRGYIWNLHVPVPVVGTINREGIIEIITPNGGIFLYKVTGHHDL